MELEIYSSETIDKKLEFIREELSGKSVVVAFSGGVDSTVLAYLCGKFADTTLLVMQTGSSIAIGEVQLAQQQAEQLNLPIEFIEYDEVDYSDDYAANPSNRCYYCKQLLHGFLEKKRHALGFDLVVSGTNASDLQGHRPGHQAALEAGVVNPLADASLSKQEIRWIANDAGLNAWDKPASACLASRFVTGVQITKTGLRRVAEAEYYLRTHYGVRVLRVRDHGGLARIEIGSDELAQFCEQADFDSITSHLKQLGFDYVTLDMNGYRPYVPVEE